ncbi:AAA family ATPase [Blautia caecimuris]|uniref:AAA family ATPase n=1 Tax=Blautia caecimuris TaxID=1796615 RepID=UPI0039951F8F
MGKIIVIGSQKGGVGKTTTTLNLAYSLREMGKKVLTVDFDSQANLTTCYGIEDTGALEYSIGHLMMAQIEEELPENLEDYIQSREGVDYIPSSIYLSVVDAKLRTEMGAERMLAEVLEPLKSRYDYILIDTCPSLGMLPLHWQSYLPGVLPHTDEMDGHGTAVYSSPVPSEHLLALLLFPYRPSANLLHHQILFSLN